MNTHNGSIHFYAKKERELDKQCRAWQIRTQKIGTKCKHIVLDIFKAIPFLFNQTTDFWALGNMWHPKIKLKKQLKKYTRSKGDNNL